VADAGRCFVVTPGEGRLIDLGDFEVRVKADAESTRGVVSVLEATEPSGFGPPVHVHDDAAEAFYVLSRRTAEPEAQLLLPGGDDGLLR